MFVSVPAGCSGRGVASPPIPVLHEQEAASRPGRPDGAIASVNFRLRALVRRLRFSMTRRPIFLALLVLALAAAPGVAGSAGGRMHRLHLPPKPTVPLPAVARGGRVRMGHVRGSHLEVAAGQRAHPRLQPRHGRSRPRRSSTLTDTCTSVPLGAGRGRRARRRARGGPGEAVLLAVRRHARLARRQGHGVRPHGQPRAVAIPRPYGAWQ